MSKVHLSTRTMAAALLAAPSADAHIVGARLGDFYAGALHPLTDLQDLILWTALGLLAGSMGSDKGKWLVPLLPLGLLAGWVPGVLLHFGSPWPVLNAGLMVLLGLLLASGIRIPKAPLCAIALVLAMIRGAINANGMGPDTNQLLFAAGLAGAGYVAITLLMAATLAFRGSERQGTAVWRGIALRVCGSWIAAIGLMVGGFALAN